MIRIIFTAVLFFGVLGAGCASPENEAAKNSDRKPDQKPDVSLTNANSEKNQTELNAALRARIERIAAEAKGRVGVKAEILETGKAVDLSGDEQFPMQSVYKLPIGMAILRQVDEGKIKLDQIVKIEKTDFVRPGMYSAIRDKNPNGTEMTVEELLRFSVSESDGTASDVLLDLVGVEAVGQYLEELGVRNLNVLDSEKEIGKDWETQFRNRASPAGAVMLLRALHERRGGLSEKNQALLLKFMIESPRGQKRLKGLLPANAVVAHKTGTSGTRDGVTAATNDIGIVTLPNGQHLAIAVFVSDSRADEKIREAVIAKIAKTVWDEWGK